MKIATAQIWVHDQNEALDFYTSKLGMEVRADVTLPEMGDFRWLTVGPTGQPDISIVLMAIPGPPVMDGETAEQVRSLTAKGFAGTIFLTSEDVRAGDVVGEVAVLSSGRRTASVVATTPLRALTFFKRDVWALEREAPEAARRLRAALEQHVGS